MAYKLRDRKQKRIYVISSSSSSESDSSSSLFDPDYSRTRRPRRQPPQNIPNKGTIATDIEMMDMAAGRPRRRRRNKRAWKLSSRANYSETTRQEQPKTKRTILSWLIDKEIIEENAQVWYMDETRERILLKGVIKRAGIVCDCCNKEITVWEFEIHAHDADKGDDIDDDDRLMKRPYANIFLAKKRVSLLECQLMGSKHYGFNKIEPRENAVDRNDDACMICADGGDLICCDKCPSTFHTECMHIQSIPQDDWLCPYCVCKYCGLAGYGDAEFFTCSQCQKKYHWACYLEQHLDLNSPVTPVTPVTPVNSFCGHNCREIFEYLERVVGVRNKLGGGLSWSLIRQTDLQTAAPIDNLHQVVESNCKIALVCAIMDESFATTIDRHTNVNIIQSVVYNQGSNLNRINFQGFYTAILEKDDEIISAASLRIHGKKIAEMPFVATHENYRHKGMWRKLLTAIESVLCFLKVECLVMPSIEDLVTMWTEKYGFSKADDSLKKDLIFFNTLMFAKAVTLQKTLLKSDCINSEAMEVDEVKNNDNLNGVDPRQNQKNHMVQSEMEIDEVDDNDNQTVQNGRNLGQKLRKVPLLDLNLEPPEEGEMLALGTAWNRLTEHNQPNILSSKDSGPRLY